MFLHPREIFLHPHEIFLYPREMKPYLAGMFPNPRRPQSGELVIAHRLTPPQDRSIPPAASSACSTVR